MHNDIKYGSLLFYHEYSTNLVQFASRPANILLSAKKVPMFVDFGFAEKYELGAKRAFMSNLAYGTPEVD